MKEASILMVVGMHRSGTSAMTGVLARLGISVPGDMMLATKDNPKGYYENTDVFLKHEAFFRETDSSWDNPVLEPMDEGKFSSLAADIEGQILEPLREENSFVIKDPRLCVVMPAWLEASLKAGRIPKCLQIFRHPSAVAASLAARDAIETDHSFLLWAKYVISAERSTRGVSRCFVDFDDLLADWRSSVRQVVSQLELSWLGEGEEGIDDFLERELRHHVSPDEKLTWQAGPGLLCQRALVALNLLKSDPYDTQAITIMDRCFVRLRDCAELQGGFLKSMRQNEANAKRSFDQRLKAISEENYALRNKLESRAAEMEDALNHEKTRADSEGLVLAPTRSAALSWHTMLQNRRYQETIDKSSLLLEQKTGEIDDAKVTIAFLQGELARLNKASS